MADPEHVITDEQQAQETLDTHFAMSLGSMASDVRRPGWTVIQARTDSDPMAFLFGQRYLMRLVAPVARRGERPRGGIAVVAPELRVEVTALLRELPPEHAFTPKGRATLGALVESRVPARVWSGEPVHARLWYALPGGFRPYLGPWLDWIEPLDDARESDPVALGLLARYSAGVYVVRQAGEIVSFAGIRAQSPHVWEVHTRTQWRAEGAEELSRAVIARATKAVLAARRLPLFTYVAGDEDCRRSARALGFARYGDSLTFLAAL